MIKKLLFGLIAATLVFTSANTTVLAKGKNEIKIVHNNVEQKQAVQPEMKNGTVFVPVRAIFDALLINYTYDEKTKTVSAKQGDRSIELVLNKKDAKVNGKAHKLNDTVYTVNGYTFVPLRLIGETFGANIIWESKTQSVKIITAHDPKPTVPTDNSVPTKPQELVIKDEADFKKLQQLTTKHPKYFEDHLRYIILDKKDASWLAQYLKKATKDDIQNSLEIALISGNVDAARYILTNYKSSISNKVDFYNNATLYLNTFTGKYMEYFVRLEPNASRLTYQAENTVESSLALIDLLASHGFKPSNLDLLRGIGGHTEIQIPTIEKLVSLGLDLNASVPEYVSLDPKTDAIKFGIIGKSNVDNVHTPIFIQSYYITIWNYTEENLRKFEAIIRLGGSLELLSSEQKARLVEVTNNRAGFEALNQMLQQ